MRIVLVTKDLSSNSTGRTYVLWMLARHLGWQVKVIAPRGDKVWGPVATPDFVSACEHISMEDVDRWDEAAAVCDLLVAVKVHEDSFGLALRLSKRHGKPVLLDIDDPDLEAQKDSPAKSLARAIIQPRRFWRRRVLVSRMRKYPHMVSNPALQRTYGGAVIPHARHDNGPGRVHESSEPIVVFAGTNRAHKGLNVLREAVDKSRGDGVKLVVTDQPPSDAKSHESWVGNTTLEEGIELVKNGDIVVIPSLPDHAYSQGQLPVKIMDAMLAARAVVVSDLPPLRWAVGDTGIVVPPGDADALAKTIHSLASPARRNELGDAARLRAREMFTVEAVSGVFEAACEGALGR